MIAALNLPVYLLQPGILRKEFFKKAPSCSYNASTKKFILHYLAAEALALSTKSKTTLNV